MKKKYIVFMILLSLFFVGCGKQKSTTTETNSVKKDTYSFVYEGVDITPGTEFSADKIKKEATVSEIPSCAFEGSDTVYTYDDIEITVANKDGKKIVYSVYFISPNTKTTEGISIDSTKEDVISKYGNSNEEAEIKYTKGDVELHFVINNNVVTSIEYVLAVEK